MPVGEFGGFGLDGRLPTVSRRAGISQPGRRPIRLPDGSSRCGEHAPRGGNAMSSFGSSRVRGTLKQATDRAANRYGSSPRMRGTHVATTAKAFVDGSSPRVRGTQPGSRGYVFREAVHPRACGEHSPGSRGYVFREAVHPTHCGEHQQPRRAAADRGRFIPARVRGTPRAA